MNFSAKIKLRTDQIKADGTATIYLQVILNRKPKKIPLQLSWPPDRFDMMQGLCKSRFKNDPDVNDYNMIIRDSISQANEIFKFYRLTKQNLTMEKFLLEYNNKMSKTDFLLYYEGKLARRVKRREIEKGTRKNHQNTLNKLKAFYKELLFQDINKDRIEDFAIHMKHDLKLSKNTIWGHMRDVATYLSLARYDDKIIFDEGYKDIKIQPVDGKTEPLSVAEFKKLYKYFWSDEATPSHRTVLRPFLFSCLTGGIRISDQMSITHDHVKDGFLVMVPYKTRKGGKLVQIPILPDAMKLINTRQGKLFHTLSEQKANGILKEIAAALEIKKNIHHHVARETFGTIYIEMGGNPAVLKEIMGHSKYSITLKYVHVNNKMKAEQMKLMSGLMAP